MWEKVVEPDRIMWEKVVEPDISQMAIQYGTCSWHAARDMQYAILIASPR
jgi:hypothetical protein